MAASIVEAHVGETPIVRGYLVDEADVALTQASISSINYNVVDTDADDPTESIGTDSLVIADVIFDTPYTHDSRTWNFRWIQPTVAVVGGHTTKTLLTVVTVGGLTIIEPVKVKGVSV